MLSFATCSSGLSSVYRPFPILFVRFLPSFIPLSLAFPVVLFLFPLGKKKEYEIRNGLSFVRSFSSFLGDGDENCLARVGGRGPRDGVATAHRLVGFACARSTRWLAFRRIGSKRLCGAARWRRQRTPGFRGSVWLPACPFSRAGLDAWVVHQTSGEGKEGWT